MSDFVNKPILKKLNRKNPISRIEKLESRTGAKPSDTVRSLDELSISSGTLNEGAFVDPSDDSGSEEPTDSTFSGVFLTGDSFTPADEAGAFNFGKVESGVTKYGLNGSGTYSNGLDFFNVQKATGTSTAERRLRSGFQELQDNDDPSYLFEFLDTNVGANLITLNPNFETGDSTGLTLGGGSAVVATSTIGSPSGWGTYCLELDEDAGDSATIDKYACTVGNTIYVSFDAQHRNGVLPDSWFTVYIRFYNAVPTLLSSAVVLSKTTEPLPLGNYSGTAVVPTGATQFDIYIYRTLTLPGTTYFDNFSATVVTISNEFGFHGEDGQLLMGNGKFKTNDLGSYISRGNLSGVVYANNTRTNITQTSTDTTTVFDITVPANFFSKGQLRIKANGYVDQNATNRTMTFTLRLGAAGTVTIEFGGGGANVISAWSFEGTIGKGGTDTQDLFVRMENFTNGATLLASEMERAQATETEANALACSATLGLSGGVDAGWFENVVVESIMNVDVW